MTENKKSNKSRRNNTDTIAASVRRLYSKSAPLLLVEALLLGIVAIVMVFRPVDVLSMLTIVIGGALIIFGLYRMIAGLITARNYGGGGLDVFFGLLGVLIGVLFCAYPVGSLIGVVYIFVILFLFKALGALIFAINMTRARFGHYVFDLIMAIALVALAVLLLVYPVAAPIMLVYYLALTLLTYAISDMYMFIELVRLRRAIDD